MNDQLQHILDSATLLIPEAIITTSLIITILLGLILKTKKHAILKSLALISYGICIFTIIHHLPTESTLVFGGMMRIDAFSSYFKILFLTGGILGVWISGPQKENSSAEYFLLFHAVILGSCLLASSMNFIMLILSLELISLSSYLLAGFGFNKKSAEGSLKYFLFGTVATACMIYGLSIIYGFAGTLDFSSELFLKNLIVLSSPLLLIAGLLTLAGFLFKISAVPFHLWAPDVYESAPTSVVAFI
jgi:NADH-quinone oxidoreductase subunit N